ncbi:MAG: metallophosphoesterase [Clostridiales bacterium]|jgi:3-oxoacid CoA-transferase subunit A|nr:metallophosphoesterase [Clostridiales bacterium]
MAKNIEKLNTLEGIAMFYITGDTHRDFRRVSTFCNMARSTKDDVLIILGDAGINYFRGEKDLSLKRRLEALPITLFCIHGNHEQRPESLNYAQTEWNGGAVYWEPEFPNLLFAKCGEVYELFGKRCIAVGGAYSVDKPIRLAEGLGWWPDEQPSGKIRDRVEARMGMDGWRVDIVLSHTCPLKYEPREMFLSGIDEARVDKSTEKWLDAIEDKLDYKRWYCGHYHTDKTIDKLRFIFNDILELR